MFYRNIKKIKIMSYLNEVNLIGNTGDEIKMHFFENEDCVGRVPLATNKSWKNKQTGETMTQTEWHNLVFRNNSAKAIEKYCRKGNRLYVKGELRTRKWQDQQGQDRYSTEIHVSQFIFLTSKNEQPASQPQQSTSSGPSSEPFVTDGNDDLPF